MTDEQFEQQDILHCPFCGSEAKAYASHYANLGEHWVICLSPNCGGKTHWWASRDQAIAAWNQRATPKPAPEALHGYWQVEPIEGQMPTITTTYCQGCQEKEAELVSLRQEKNEAIGAALAVEQKCYDQAQEIKTLRETIAARERNLEFRANLITEQRNELIKAEAELAPLRALRKAANTIYDDLTHYGRDDMASIRQIHGWREALRYALLACDEASAPTGDEHTK